MMTFASSPSVILPSIAQLVERWTVVVHCQTSIGRWFKSGSKDFFFTSTQLFITDRTDVSECRHFVFRGKSRHLLYNQEARVAQSVER